MLPKAGCYSSGPVQYTMYSTVQYHERNAKKLFDNTVHFAALQYTPVQEHILLCHGQVTDLQCTVHGYRYLVARPLSTIHVLLQGDKSGIALQS